MRIGKIAGIIGAVLVLTVGVGGAYLASLDVDEYRSEIAQAAQDATGRVLQLDGPLSLSVSLSPTVSGEGISLANAPWGSRPQMMTLSRFELQLRLLPLLFGAVQVKRLILIEPDILLETDANGRGNWVFGAPGSGKGEATADDGGTMPDIGRLLIENGLLTYRDGVTGETTRIKLTAVKAEANSTNDPLHLDVLTSVNDMVVKLSGTAGPLKNAFTVGEPLQVDLTVQGQGLTAKIKGSAKAATRTMDARVELSAGDLSGLRPLLGDAVPANLSLKLDVQVKAAGGTVGLSDLRLILGNSDLAGNLSMDTSGALPKLTADLSGKRLDLAQLSPPAKKDNVSKGRAGKESSRPGRVFPAARLPLDALKALDSEVKLSLAEVVAPGISLRQLSAVASLKNGRLTLKPMTLTVAGSNVQLSASVDAGPKIPTMAIEITAPKLDVGRLLDESKITDLVQGTGSLSITLAGRGDSVAAIAGTLNGTTSLLMKEGKVKTKALDAAIDGLSAVMGMMSPAKSDWTVLNCVASRFEIKNGIATSQVLLADTEFSTVVGEGQLDLGREVLAMKVSPQSKSATLNVAVPIKIGGTFAEPTFRPDELATARRLSGLLGMSLFPPLALLALGDMGSGDDNPCLKLALGGAKQPAAAGGTESLTAPMDSLKKTLESLFNKKQ
ncbi:MAG: AsmA family protein [Proteobacteria bacterium]|nr:AsmA family protein [Pseudomonadota bacterium]